MVHQAAGLIDRCIDARCRVCGDSMSLHPVFGPAAKREDNIRPAVRARLRRHEVRLVLGQVGRTGKRGPRPPQSRLRHFSSQPADRPSVSCRGGRGRWRRGWRRHRWIRLLGQLQIEESASCRAAQPSVVAGHEHGVSWVAPRRQRRQRPESSRPQQTEDQHHLESESTRVPGRVPSDFGVVDHRT